MGTMLILLILLHCLMAIILALTNTPTLFDGDYANLTNNPRYLMVTSFNLTNNPELEDGKIYMGDSDNKSAQISVSGDVPFLILALLLQRML